MNDDEIKAVLGRVKTKLRVTKVVATRAVKTKSGDYFAGFSAAWNTIQDDGEQGLEDGPAVGEASVSGMTLQEARVAHFLVAMQADVAAHESALASGALSLRACEDAVKSIRANYLRLIRMVLNGAPVPAEAQALAGK